MTKKTRLQITATQKTLDDVALYMNQHGVNQSQAAKTLLELGCRVWQETEQTVDGGLSTIDALKQLLKSTYTIQAFLSITANKRIAKANNEQDKPYHAAPLIDKAKALANTQLDELLSHGKVQYMQGYNHHPSLK